MDSRRHAAFAHFSLAVLAGLIGVRTATAQPVPLPSQKLDQVLDAWETAMKGVVAFEGDVSRKDVLSRFNTTEIFVGKIRILKTPQDGVLASLELTRKDDATIKEKLLLNQRGVCQYDFRREEVRIHPIAVRPDRADNPIGFLLGIKAAALKARFDLTLGQDANYSYIWVLPKTDADKAGFAKARVSLLRSTSMPAQLWFQQVNQNETQWDMPNPNLRPALQVADFAATVPTGWRAVEAPRPTPAAVPGSPTVLPK